MDGEPREVEVDLAGGVATVGKVRLPFQVRSDGPGTIELEVAGERIMVADWPNDTPEPRSAVTVEGEHFALHVRAGPAITVAAAPLPHSSLASPVTASVTEDPTAVVPPMPGRVIEVRVTEGEHVRAGAVLVVVEAMKMRNEVASPRTGTVRDLRVGPGSAVKARQPMLRIVPD